MAIQATNAGIDFQQRISALMMVCMEFEIEMDMIFEFGKGEKIENLNFEASEKIDDLVITTTGNKKVYLQMKRNISFSSEEDSEFYGVCTQFVNQYCENNRSDLAYVLVTRSQASRKISLKLKRILEGIRIANTIHIDANLNQDEILILEGIKLNVKKEFMRIKKQEITDETLTKMLKRMYIEILDVEEGEGFEKNIKLILHKKLNIDVNLFWGMLVSMAVQYGANRRGLAKAYLHEQIKGYIERQDVQEYLCNIEWEGEKVEIRKDYIVALNKQLDEEGNPLYRNKVFAMENYRFNEYEKKRTVDFITPNIMKCKNGLNFEVIFRCSSHRRLEEFIQSEEFIKFTNEETEIIVFPIAEEVEENEVERAYEELIKGCLNSQRENRCINCGKTVLEEGYMIELDNVECSEKAGMIHKECLRPIDRVLGLMKIPNSDKYTYLKNFDINSWIKLVKKGKTTWESLESMQQTIYPVIINTDEIFFDGRYCIRTLLNNGEIQYATHRGKIHRMSKREAEDFAKQLSTSYKEALEKDNPMCYTSETYTFGEYNQLISSMNNEEELLECIDAEMVIYNDTIARMYNQSNTFYTPIIYLSVDGEPVIYDGIFPLFTNPLEISRYIKNWSKAGVEIGNYEVNIISNDSDFILKCLSLIMNGIRPIVNLIMARDKKPIKGYLIHIMKEIEMMHSQNK